MRAHLRRWGTADAAALHAAVVESPDLGTQLGGADLGGVGDCAAFIDAQLARSSPSSHNFAVAVDGRAVGNVGISNIESVHDTAWVYYWLTTSVRGSGLATRGLATLAQWALDELGLFRLELGHRVNNPASCRVAAGAGFPAEGVERAKCATASSVLMSRRTRGCGATPSRQSPCSPWTGRRWTAGQLEDARASSTG